MPKFDKPDSPNIIWGVNAVEGDLTRPSNSKIQTGWIQEKPPYEFENYSMNKLYQGVAYYNQLGFPEWDSVTEYQAGKSYVQGSNNRVYKCIQTHTNRNPATSGNESWWELFEGNRQATETQRGTSKLASPSEAFQGTSNNSVLTPLSLASGVLGNLVSGENGNIEIPCILDGSTVLFIAQWARVNPGSLSNSQTVSITFPREFPNTCFQVILGDSTGIIGPSGNDEGSEVQNITKSGFSLYSAWQSHSGSFRYIAVGY